MRPMMRGSPFVFLRAAQRSVRFQVITESRDVVVEALADG